MSTQIISVLESQDSRFALKEVYKRAATNEDFRELLKEDPAAAFDSMGLSLGSWDVKFVEPSEEYDDIMQLPNVIDDTEDLSMEELEAVAGGVDWCVFTCWYSDDNDDNEQEADVKASL